MEPSIADTDLLDILFGVSNQTQPNQSQNLNQSPNSPVYSTVSEPGYGMLERWEPGEITGEDYEVYSSSSSLNTSPVRPVHRRYSYNEVMKPTTGKKRGPRPKKLTMEEKRQKRLDANDRERTRMGQLNVAFSHLRNVLPRHGNDRELSKYETIHLAKNYIRSLNDLLISASEESTSSETQPTMLH